MSLEDNKALVRRYIEEVTNQGRLDRLNEFVRDDFINHLAGSTTAVGPDSLKQGIASLLSVMPDARSIIEDMTAEDDKVVVRLRLEGTSEGRSVSLPGVITYRIQDGKLAERWGQFDYLTLAAPVRKSNIGPPPRALTPNMKQYAGRSIVSPVVLGLIVAIVLLVDLILAIFLPFKTVLAIWFYSGLSIIPIAVIFIVQMIRRRQILFVLQNGEVAQAAVRSNETNWGMQVNGAPQRIVTMEIGGRPITFKTFDHTIANELPPSAVVEVLCHLRFPKIVIPIRCLM